MFSCTADAGGGGNFTCIVKLVSLYAFTCHLQRLAAEKAAEEPQMVNIPGIGMFPAGTVPGISPPMVNICPPSPQNNEDPKTGNFKV